MNLYKIHAKTCVSHNFFTQVHLRFLIVTNVPSLGNKTNDNMNERYLQDERQLIKMKYSGDIWYQQMYSLDSFSINREYSQEKLLIHVKLNVVKVNTYIQTLKFTFLVLVCCSLQVKWCTRVVAKMVNCDSRKLHVTWKYEVFFASR